ncbi:MAG: NAD(P)(+) transhydrogenase (Re/Si-specific) subunit beta [Deltaproteobacteria bacterium]|nr:MAG: NAD(P)(+) transhydrogenase (Re/Si-specific) subunit beta [Deltaproteobacteria bacterium]
MSSRETIVALAYLISSVLFILGLKRMTHVRTARRGNALSALAMLIAVVATFVELGSIDYRWIVIGFAVGGLIGAVAAVKVEMTEMPEMVALFNGSGGLASALVALSVFFGEVVEPGRNVSPAGALGAAPAVTLILSVLIGGVTFSGSVVAYGKLAGKISGNPILLPGRHFINAVLLLGSLGLGIYGVFGFTELEVNTYLVLGVAAASLILGIMAVIPIGGADMPVVISLLNSYSGLAAAATGFVLHNNVLIIAGSLVGCAGFILTQIMCVAMNRSLANVLFGGFGSEGGSGVSEDARDYKNVRSCGPEEAAMVLEAAESCIIVPGYGLAVAQAQHACKELGDLLEARGCSVKYAIHPVAGRMPGHMNVLLAEADVPYEKLVEMDQINPEFKNTDVVIVVGANDVVNPAAETTPGSPIYGMPILKVHEARTVFVIKRSLSPGFAGIKNELFERDNCMMIFGDAKAVLQQLAAELKEAAKAA